MICPDLVCTRHHSGPLPCWPWAVIREYESILSAMVCLLRPRKIKRNILTICQSDTALEFRFTFCVINISRSASPASEFYKAMFLIPDLALPVQGEASLGRAIAAIATGNGNQPLAVQGQQRSRLS